MSKQRGFWEVYDRSRIKPRNKFSKAARRKMLAKRYKLGSGYMVDRFLIAIARPSNFTRVPKI